jgi:glutamate-1-semialdehyde 2,1-aminomutase
MSEISSTTVDPALVKVLKDREDARFLETHPRSAALRERGLAVMPNGVPMSWFGAHHVRLGSSRVRRFTDVDGHVQRLQHRRHVHVLRARRSRSCARSQRMAQNQFLLPTEDAIVVSEELSRRFGLPVAVHISASR